MHNSQEEQLEAALKEAIMANPTVATYERMLERDLFKDPANAFGDDDMLTTKLKVGGTLGSEPNAVVARELDANVMGNIGNGHSLVLYALLQRAKGCVEKLLAFYPAPTCHPAIHLATQSPAPPPLNLQISSWVTRLSVGVYGV